MSASSPGQIVLGRKSGTATNFRFPNPFKNQRIVERKLAGCPLFSRPRTCTTGRQERERTYPAASGATLPALMLLRPASPTTALLLIYRIYRIFGLGSISGSDGSRAGCCRNHTSADGKRPRASAEKAVAECVKVWWHSCYASCKSFAISQVQPGPRFQKRPFSVRFRRIQRRFRRCRTVASLSASHMAGRGSKKYPKKMAPFWPGFRFSLRKG